MEGPLVLGIDGGGSSTVCIVADMKGEILGRGFSGPSNHQTSPWRKVAESLKTAISIGLDGRPKTQVISVCAGLAGVDWPGSEQPIMELLEDLFPNAHISVVPDVAIALYSVITRVPGAVVVSGTGSMGYAEREDGSQVKVGGWGALIGDEGSGYDIGKKGLQAATRAFDKRGPRTTLLEYACGFFHVKELRDILKRIYNGTWSPERTAGFAVYVAKAAQEGDQVAKSILEDAGRDLAATAAAVLERMNSLEQSVEVGLTGGIFLHSGEILLNSFKATLGLRAPKAKAILAEYPPVLGALILARRRYTGEESQGPFRKRLCSQLGKTNRE